MINVLSGPMSRAATAPTSSGVPPHLAVGNAVTEPKRLSRADDYQCAFFRLFKRTFALCTAAIFSGRFMRFHFLMSSLLRPQLTHRSPLNWQTEMHGFSISLAIVNNPGSRVTAQGASANRHHECVGILPQSRIGQCDLMASRRRVNAGQGAIFIQRNVLRSTEPSLSSNVDWHCFLPAIQDRRRCEPTQRSKH